MRNLLDFIRQSLDLTPLPAGITVPNQGPLRVIVGGSNKRSGGSGGKGGGNGGGGASGGIALTGSSQISETP